MGRSISSAHEVKFCRQRLLFETQTRRDGGGQCGGTLGTQSCKPTPVKGQTSLSSSLKEWRRCFGDLWHSHRSSHHLKLQQVVADSIRAQSALSAVHLSGNRGRIRQREKQALGFLPHSRKTLAGNFAASRTLYDNSGSDICHWSSPLLFSFHYFLNNAIGTTNYTFYRAHYSLSLMIGTLELTHFTSGALHAGTKPRSHCNTTSFSH